MQHRPDSFMQTIPECLKTGHRRRLRCIEWVFFQPLAERLSGFMEVWYSLRNLHSNVREALLRSFLNPSGCNAIPALYDLCIKRSNTVDNCGLYPQRQKQSKLPTGHTPEPAHWRTT